jgi:hypothetical protein
MNIDFQLYCFPMLAVQKFILVCHREMEIETTIYLESILVLLDITSLSTGTSLPPTSEFT